MLWYTSTQHNNKKKIEASPGKVSKTLSQKQNINKKGWVVAQVVEWLPSKCEAPSSIPSTDT
jgi:hypothetical protein